MSTCLLCHFNGSDGATSVSDEVPGVTWTLYTDPPAAQLDTSSVQFGSACLQLSNQADFSGVSNAPGSGDLTVEAWFAPSSASIAQSFGLSNGVTTFFALEVRYAGQDISWSIFDSGGTLIYSNAVGATLPAGAFRHIAFVRDNTANTYSLYFNGVRLDSFSSSTNMGNFTGGYIFGWSSVSPDRIDEFRISNEALYTGSTYTVPTSQFTLGTTTNIQAFSAEFDSEFGTGQASKWLTPASSEFDWEGEKALIRLTQSDPQSQYGYESGSPSISFAYQLGTSTLEFDWETSFTQQAVIGSPEIDWEVGSVGIPTDYFIGSNQTPYERDWEVNSPGVFTKGFLRGVTPTRRRVIAGRSDVYRRLEPQFRAEVTASRRTEVFNPSR